MARELATDSYIPLITSLAPDASDDESREWVERQQGRHAEGAGFSFAIVEASTERSVGHCGLWLRELDEGRGTIGYSVAPSARGRGLASDALTALTEFGWDVPGLFRIALHIEPWNLASRCTAERAGYVHEGLMRSHQEIGGHRRDMLLLAVTRP